MKRFYRTLSLFLAFTLAMTFPASAAVGETVAPNASLLLRDYSATISAISSSQFKVTFEAYGTQQLDTIGASSITIYASSDGSNWSSIQTVSGLSGMTASQKSSYKSFVTFDGDGEFYYMAKVTIIGMKGSTTETRNVYTGTIHL